MRNTSKINNFSIPLVKHIWMYLYDPDIAVLYPDTHIPSESKQSEQILAESEWIQADSEQSPSHSYTFWKKGARSHSYPFRVHSKQQKRQIASPQMLSPLLAIPSTFQTEFLFESGQSKTTQVQFPNTNNEFSSLMTKKLQDTLPSLNTACWQSTNFSLTLTLNLPSQNSHTLLFHLYSKCLSKISYWKFMFIF
jgi:hypothetical protein